MRMSRAGWIVGSLSLLLGASFARAEEPIRETTTPATPSGSPEQLTIEGDKPECKDAGVTVSFATASSELDTNARGALNGVATWLKMRDQRTIKLQGYADKKGSAGANKRLSERRAAAVKDYLLGQGIEPERIMTAGLGEESDHLPASGRTVTVVTCDVPTKVVEEVPPPVEAEPEPAPAPPPVVLPPPAPAPAPIAPVAVIPAPPPPPLAPATPAVPKSDRPPSGVGVEASVGGGVIGFVDNGARSFSNPGGSWEARMTFGSRLPLAFEAAYIGSAQGIDALGLGSNAMLIGNGAEGTLRINFTTSRVQPYLFGGAGFTRYQVTNTNINTSSVQSVDDVGTIPTGIGLSARLSKEFFIDLRGTYRFTYNDQLFTTASADSGAGKSGLDTWNAIGRLGFEF